MTTERQLPSGWRWVRLGEVCEAIRGVTFPSGAARPDPSPDRIACLTTSAVQEEVAWATACHIPVSFMRSPRQVVREGDLLVSTANSKALVGKTAMARRIPHPATFGAFVTVLRPLGVDPCFLFYGLRTQDARRHFFTESSETTNISNLRSEDMLAYALPLPALVEQRRIAAVLNEQMAAVDRARAAAQARLEAVNALPAALLREVFGDLPTIAASPVTPATPVKPGWSWHRLTDVARLATGHTPSRYHPEYWQGMVPWLQLADIRALDGHEAQDTSEHTNELGIANSAAVLLPTGTVCMSRTASVGFFTVMGRPMATSQDFVNWVCSDALDPWFLMYLMIANRTRIRGLGSGAVHQTIYFPTVQAFSVCVPAIGDQRRLAAMLQERMAVVATARAAAETELATINALPAALLRRAFNGEV